MMDRALKERVIGAVVLVVFAVLLVPVFLDGESAGIGQVEETLVLPGQDEARQKTIVLDRDRDQPVPVARSTRDTATKAVEPVESESEPEAPPAGQKPEPSPEKVARTSTETSTTGMWAVQLGSFSDQQNAERLAAELRKQGFAAFLSQTRSGSRQLHRVRIGPQKDRSSAESVATKLKAAGHDGQVVPHP